jgi:hypothetical protein
MILNRRRGRVVKARVIQVVSVGFVVRATKVRRRGVSLDDVVVLLDVNGRRRRSVVFLVTVNDQR